MKQPKKKEDKMVFFFNSSTNFTNKAGELKGSKLKSSDESKILTLKNKQIQRNQLMKARYSFYQQQAKQANQHPLTQRQRASHDNWYYRSLYKRFHPIRRSINQQSDIMITSQSNSLPKQLKARDLPRFSSTNLQGKMNQYLNIIIKKSHDSHQQKIKKIYEQEKEQKTYRAQNLFYRRMKISQNRRKFQKEQQQLSLNTLNRQFNTQDVLNNLNRFKRKRSMNQVQQEK